MLSPKPMAEGFVIGCFKDPLTSWLADLVWHALHSFHSLETGAWGELFHPILGR